MTLIPSKEQIDKHFGSTPYPWLYSMRAEIDSLTAESAKDTESICKLLAEIDSLKAAKAERISERDCLASHLLEDPVNRANYAREIALKWGDEELLLNEDAAEVATGKESIRESIADTEDAIRKFRKALVDISEKVC